MNISEIIKVKKLKEEAIIPIKGSEYAAGWDLYAYIESNSIIINPHETIKIGTGLSFELPHGFFGAVFARSGLSAKQGLRPGNCVGVCDEDYRGEYIIALHNDTDIPQTIFNKDRIAQLVIIPYLDIEIVESDLSETQRGVSGFGSTGNR